MRRHENILFNYPPLSTSRNVDSQHEGDESHPFLRRRSQYPENQPGNYSATAINLLPLENSQHFENYYQVLDVENTATYYQIKQAFKRKALKFHPDKNRNQDAGSIFSQIHQAYTVLADPIKRCLYDQHVKVEDKQASSPQLEIDIERLDLSWVSASFFASFSLQGSVKSELPLSST